ncbi:hypothetical protein D3C72_1557900 [compost metagenome]
MLAQEVAIDGDGAVELEGVQRLLVDQRHIALHQLACRRALLLQRLCLARRGLAHAVHGGVELAHGHLDVRAGGITLAGARGQRQRELRAAQCGQRGLRAFRRDGAAHVALIQRVSVLLEGDQIEDANQADHGPEDIDQNERRGQPRRQRQSHQPLPHGFAACARQTQLDGLQHETDSCRDWPGHAMTRCPPRGCLAVPPGCGRPGHVPVAVRRHARRTV